MDREDSEKLRRENIELRLKLDYTMKELEISNNRVKELEDCGKDSLVAVVDTLYQELEKIESYQLNVSSLVGLMTDMVKVGQMIEDNAGAISTSIRMKTRAKHEGVEHHRYNHYVDNDVLKNEYIANGYQITKEMKANYTGIMSYGGITNRLKELGVWKGRS